jgi:hypothetical protein
MSDPDSKRLTLSVDIRNLLELTSGLVRKEWVVRELIQNATDALIARVIDDPIFTEESALVVIKANKALRQFDRGGQWHRNDDKPA